MLPVIGDVVGVLQVIRNMVSVLPGMGGGVVGSGTLVGSGGAGPQAPEVSLMSSRAISFLNPLFFIASNSTCRGQSSD